MSPEKKDQKVKDALKAINQRLSKALARSAPRLHDEGRENLYHTGRALRNLCGTCANAEISLNADRHVPNQSFVLVKCRLGLRPINISRDTPLGQNLICTSYRPK